MSQKLIIGLFLLIVGILTQTQLSAQQGKRFAVKSGHIEYQLTGNTTGTKSVWFDDYGMKLLEIVKSTTTTKMFGMTSTEQTHTQTIQMGGYFYSANYVDNTHTKGKLPFYSEVQEWSKTKSDAELKKMADDILNSLGGERLGTETFLGKPCEVITVMGAKSWIYQGIVLKSEVSVMGITTNETATLFEANIKIPGSKFTPPSNVEYQDIDELQNQYMNAMDGYSEDESSSSNEEPSFPLSFPYEKFISVAGKLDIPGYTKYYDANNSAEYMVVYMKQMAFTLSVVATSDKDIDVEKEFKSDAVEVEKTTLNQHKAYVGKTSEETEDGAIELNIVSIHYPEHQMVVSLISSGNIQKEELKKLAGKLKF